MGTGTGGNDQNIAAEVECISQHNGALICADSYKTEVEHCKRMGKYKENLAQEGCSEEIGGAKPIREFCLICLNSISSSYSPYLKPYIPRYGQQA